MLCQFVKNAECKWQCTNCGWVYRHFDDSPPVAACKGNPGPGDCLHKAILRWVGEGPTRECGCTDRINQMNAWGASGCREHLGEIVGWLEEEAKKRGWWRFAVAVPGSRYFIKWLVLSAIRKAEISPVDTRGAPPPAATSGGDDR